MLKVRILTDDRVRKRGLLAEHGLSLWIEKDGQSILFDTGQTSVYTHNAEEMGIKLEKADCIVVSHGHYDHGGGLQYFPSMKNPPTIYAHPDAFLKKYASVNQDEPSREVGMPFELSQQAWLKEHIVYTKEPLRIDEGIFLSGQIPRKNNFEEVPVDFYYEKDGLIKEDKIWDEQMLIIVNDDEIALFLGCSHPGIINCIQYARELVPDKSIRLLIAGMHLDNVEPSRLNKTIQILNDMDIRNIVPMHCTGFEAMCKMRSALGDRCQLLCTGDEVEVW